MNAIRFIGRRGVGGVFGIDGIGLDGANGDTLPDCSGNTIGGFVVAIIKLRMYCSNGMPSTAA